MNELERAGFGRVVDAVAPYLDQLVIVGAWCHRLLRYHRVATPPSFDPLMTEDADLATPSWLPTRSPSLYEALTASGFKAHLSGDGKLPLAKYFLDGDQSSLYIEFISWLQGSGYDRKGEPNDILAISGVTAQKLRHVELLLLEPWELECSPHQGFTAVSAAKTLRVANPASYLAQKVLTLRKRGTSAKQAKDALYVHDTLALFGGALPALREQALRIIAQLGPRARADFHRLRSALFQDLSLMIGAERIARATGRASAPSATTIAAVCAAGLDELFRP